MTYRSDPSVFTIQIAEQLKKMREDMAVQDWVSVRQRAGYIEILAKAMQLPQNIPTEK